MRRLGLALALLAVAGCGRSAATPPPQNEWAANMRVVIGQLRNDVAQTQVIGVTAEAGREALQDESVLYGLLVAYSDLAGCRHIVASTGAPPPGAGRVERPLAKACSHLERASSLFSRAAQTHNGQPLAAATRQARVALPALVEAAAALSRETGAR